MCKSRVREEMSGGREDRRPEAEVTADELVQCKEDAKEKQDETSERQTPTVRKV